MINYFWTPDIIIHDLIKYGPLPSYNNINKIYINISKKYIKKYVKKYIKYIKNIKITFGVPTSLSTISSSMDHYPHNKI